MGDMNTMGMATGAGTGAGMGAGMGTNAPVPADMATGAAPQSRRRRVKPARHGFLSFLLWLATFGVLGVMALRQIPNGLDGKRQIPMIVAFVPWMAAVSLVTLLLGLLWHRRLLALVSIACLVLQVSWHIGFFRPSASISDEATAAVSASVNTKDKYARVMTLNTCRGRADAATIVSLVKSQHIEVLALQEMTEGFIQRLTDAGIYQVLPHSVIADFHTGDNGGVNGLFTAARMSNVSDNLIDIDSSRIPAATITIGSTKVRFGSVHPSSPTRGNQGVWNSGLDSISSLKEYDHTYVMMGDFNATWDHPSFRAILGDRFVDSSEQAGEGFHMTYPANSTIPPMIEIDHIIHDKGVTAGDLTTVEVPSSDHMALLGTLEAAQ